MPPAREITSGRFPTAFFAAAARLHPLASEPSQRRRREQSAPLVLAFPFRLAGIPTADRHADLPDGGERHALPPTRKGQEDNPPSRVRYCACALKAWSQASCL